MPPTAHFIVLQPKDSKNTHQNAHNFISSNDTDSNGSLKDQSQRNIRISPFSIVHVIRSVPKDVRSAAEQRCCGSARKVENDVFGLPISFIRYKSGTKSIDSHHAIAEQVIEQSEEQTCRVELREPDVLRTGDGVFEDVVSGEGVAVVDVETA